MREFLAYISKRLRPHLKTVLFCLCLAFAASLLEMAMPIFLGKSFDFANRKAALLLCAAALVGWFVARTLAKAIRERISRIGSDITTTFDQQFDQEAIGIILRKPMSFFVSRDTYTVSNKITSAGGDMVRFISDGIFDFVPNIISLAIAAAYLGAIDLRIMAVFIVTIVAYAWYVNSAAPETIRLRKASRRAQQDAGQFGWSAVWNPLIVKASGGEGRTVEGLKALEKNVRATAGAVQRFSERVFNLQNLILGGGQFAISMLSLMEFRAGTFSIGTLTAINSYTVTVFGSVQFFQYVFRLVVQAVPSFQEAMDLLREPEEDYESGHAVDLKGGVEFRNVRFRYSEERPILEDVSFTTKPGERIAIVGESGEGKSTLVDLISRYYLPQSGEIAFDGMPSSEVNLVSLRAQIASVSQDLSLFHKSLRYNIAYGRQDATEEQLRKAVRMAHLEDFISKLPEGWDKLVGEDGLKLSGGERQRVALARAFLRDPKILVLDEPTSNLDSRTEAIIQDSLTELMKGRTTFIIAHRLKTVMHADRILVLKDGRIAEQGTHEMLAKKGGAYAALLKAQGAFVADAA